MPAIEECSWGRQIDCLPLNCFQIPKMMTRAPRTPVEFALCTLILLTGCRPPVLPKLHLVSGKVAAGHETMPYAVALPPGYSRQQRWPVLLFLHGFGERGEDGVSQTGGMGQF